MNDFRQKQFSNALRGQILGQPAQTGVQFRQIPIPVPAMPPELDIAARLMAARIMVFGDAEAREIMADESLKDAAALIGAFNAKYDPKPEAAVEEVATNA